MLRTEAGVDKGWWLLLLLLGILFQTSFPSHMPSDFCKYGHKWKHGSASCKQSRNLSNLVSPQISWGFFSTVLFEDATPGLTESEIRRIRYVYLGRKKWDHSDGYACWWDLPSYSQISSTQCRRKHPGGSVSSRETRPHRVQWEPEQSPGLWATSWDCFYHAEGH